MKLSFWTAMMRYLAIYFLILCAFLPSATAVFGDSPETCAAIRENAPRLECYDLIFKKIIVPDTSTSGKGKWDIKIEKSKLDDSQNVTLMLQSEDEHQNQYGQSSYLYMIIRCLENKTNFLFFVDQFLADSDGSNILTYRIDDKKAEKKKLDVSNNHKALGLWESASAISFIKKLVPAHSVYTQVTPFNESSVSATFDVTGLEIALTALRKSCNW